MKTYSLVSKLAGAASLLALTLSFTSIAKAGPGIDYWRRVNPIDDTKQVQPVAVAAQQTDVCADAKPVAITVAQKGWVNGRGPLQITQVGSKEVCGSCAGTTTAMKKGWVNARGPLQSTEVTTEHVCSSCSTETHA